MTEQDKEYLAELAEFVNNLPKADAPENNACVQACKEKFDSCMADAGSSTAAQAVCNTRYRNCLVSC